MTQEPSYKIKSNTVVTRERQVENNIFSWISSISMLILRIESCINIPSPLELVGVRGGGGKKREVLRIVRALC